MFVKRIFYLFAFILAVQELPAQDSVDIHAYDDGASYAPLLLFTNGPGKIIPFQSGQMLQVGREYRMIAIADRAYAFTNWMPVIVFNFRQVSYDPVTLNPVSTNESTVLAPVHKYIQCAALEFTMQPEEVIFDSPSLSITQDFGWQANFEPLNRGGSHEGDCK